MAIRCMSLQCLCHTCVRLLSDTEKVAVLDFSNYQMCGMHWIAVWVQASDLPVKVAVCFLHAAPQGQLLYRGQLGIGCGGLDWGKSWTLCAYCWIVTWHT
ncbi:hypothetical protein AMELA_G00181320 [Ameiurus melas]|uniref:Uncharacterized protein n=1 Tax=Ameiurus melas TaxID=219545 RepID=A0A7J6ADZ3_AMEME|nr:hypothetical protein AMELA_G00181320 [Ameiurus melas]